MWPRQVLVDPLCGPVVLGQSFVENEMWLMLEARGRPTSLRHPSVAPNRADRGEGGKERHRRLRTEGVIGEEAYRSMDWAHEQGCELECVPAAPSGGSEHYDT